MKTPSGNNMFDKNHNVLPVNKEIRIMPGLFLEIQISQLFLSCHPRLSLHPITTDQYKRKAILLIAPPDSRHAAPPHVAPQQCPTRRRSDQGSSTLATLSPLPVSVCGAQVPECVGALPVRPGRHAGEGRGGGGGQAGGQVRRGGQVRGKAAAGQRGQALGLTG